MGLTFATPAQAVTVVSSSAYGLSANVNLTLLSALTLNAQAATANQVAGTAAPAYALTGTLARARDNLDLGTGLTNRLFVGLRQQLNTGLMTSTAQSRYPVTQVGSARAEVDNLNFTLGADSSAISASILSLIGIGAQTVISRSSVVGGTTPDAIGFTQIEGLTLSGSLFSSTVIANAAAGAYLNPAHDTVLLGVGLLGQETLRIVLNEQVKSKTATSASVSTNAIHLIFSNYTLAGIGSLTGSIVIGHSDAQIINASGEVPEPAIWAQMIMGFGLAGVVVRRRRAVVAA